MSKEECCRNNSSFETMDITFFFSGFGFFNRDVTTENCKRIASNDFGGCKKKMSWPLLKEVMSLFEGGDGSC